MSDGTIVPYGNGIDTNVVKSSLLYNEYPLLMIKTSVASSHASVFYIVTRPASLFSLCGKTELLGDNPVLVFLPRIKKLLTWKYFENLYWTKTAEFLPSSLFKLFSFFFKKL